MQFGLFGSAQVGADALEAGFDQGFHDYVNFNVEAEALGYHSTFLVEHHFTGWGQVSATLNLLTWLAAQTKTLRIGTATMVLPWHNPVLLAEQIATLEILSGGRVDLGVGKGYRHTEFKGFNIPIQESEARFDECVDILLKSWSSRERFSHDGTFWKFSDILVEPQIKQRPTMWMAAGSEASIRKVAARGFNLLLDQFATPSVHAQRIETYKQALAEHGRSYKPGQIAVARTLHIANDENDKQDAKMRLNKTHQQMIDHAKNPDHSKGSHILSYDEGKDAPSTEGTLIGTVDEIYDKLGDLKANGIDYVLFNILDGSSQTLRRFATDLMPAFNKDPLVDDEPQNRTA